MSHELRTPLNSLLLLSRLLADDPDHNLTDKQRRVRQHHPRRRLGPACCSSTTSSTCPRSRLAGSTSRLGPVDLAEVRAYVLAAFGPQAEEKGLELRSRARPRLPTTITTDAQRLQQILRNLLSNAVKFTASGCVRLRIESAAPTTVYGIDTLDAARAVVTFIVSDTGIGIGEEKLEMIFEAFQQADGTTSRKYGGTGLGLSISKELARMLGGAIRVSSHPGVGSEFTLLLPAELPAELASAPPPLGGSHGNSDLAPILGPNTHRSGQ